MKIKGTVTLDDIEYGIKPDFYTTDNLDVDLNTCGVIVNNVAHADLSKFKNNKEFKLTIKDDGNAVENRTWLITSFNKELVSRKLKKYNIQIQGIEFTQLLQYVVIPAKAFTQPNDETITRYTLYDIMNHLLLWDIVKLELGLVVIDNSLKLLTENIKAANYRWKDKTLLECLIDLFKQIDAVPVLTRSGDQLIIGAQFYNNRNNTQDFSLDIKTELIKNTSENAINSIMTRLENVDTSRENAVIYPKEGYTTLKSDSYYLDKNSDSYISTNDMPIYDLISCEIDIPQMKVIQDQYAIFPFAWWAQVLEPSTKPEQLTEIDGGWYVLMNIDTLIANGFPTTIDISKYILEQEAKNSVRTQYLTGIIGDVSLLTSTPVSSNTLSYTRGKSHIRGIDYQNPSAGIISNLFNPVLGVDTLRAAISTSICFHPDFLSITEAYYGRTDILSFNFLDNTKFAATLGDDEWDIQYIKDFWYRTTFRTTKDIIVQTERVSNTDYGKTTKILNQADRRIDPKSVGYNNITQIEKLGLPERIINRVILDTSNLVELSDYDDREIVSTLTNIYSNYHIKQAITITENFNKTSEFIGIDSEIRTTNISADNVLPRTDILKSYLNFSYDSISESSDVISDTQGFLTGFLSDTKKLIAPIYKVKLTGVDIDGTEKYPDDAFDNESVDGKTNIFLQPNLYTTVTGRTMIYEVNIEHPASAGRVLKSNRDIGTIPYVYIAPGTPLPADAFKYDGEHESIEFVIGESIDTTQLTGAGGSLEPRNAPLILQTTTDIPASLFITNEFININKELHKDRAETSGVSYQIESKTDSNDILIYPEFLESHNTQLTREGKTYMIKQLNSSAPYITYKYRKATELAGFITNSKTGVITDNTTNVYVTGYSSSKWILVDNEDNILLVSNGTSERIYISAEDKLNEVLQGISDRLAFATLDSLSAVILSGSQIYDIYFFSSFTTDSDIYDITGATGDKNIQVKTEVEHKITVNHTISSTNLNTIITDDSTITSDNTVNQGINPKLFKKEVYYKDITTNLPDSVDIDFSKRRINLKNTTEYTIDYDINITPDVTTGNIVPGGPITSLLWRDVSLGDVSINPTSKELLTSSMFASNPVSGLPATSALGDTITIEEDGLITIQVQATYKNDGIPGSNFVVLYYRINGGSWVRMGVSEYSVVNGQEVSRIELNVALNTGDEVQAGLEWLDTGDGTVTFEDLSFTATVDIPDTPSSIDWDLVILDNSDTYPLATVLQTLQSGTIIDNTPVNLSWTGMTYTPPTGNESVSFRLLNVVDDNLIHNISSITSEITSDIVKDKTANLVLETTNGVIGTIPLLNTVDSAVINHTFTSNDINKDIEVRIKGTSTYLTEETLISHVDYKIEEVEVI